MQAEEDEEQYQTIVHMLNATTRRTQKKEWVLLCCFISFVLNLYFHYACDLTCLSDRTLRLYEKFLKIAEKGHQKAMEKVAYAMLFGDFMNQNVTKARGMFEKLAMEGSPKAQMVHLSY